MDVTWLSSRCNDRGGSRGFRRSLLFLGSRCANLVTRRPRNSGSSAVTAECGDPRCCLGTPRSASCELRVANIGTGRSRSSQNRTPFCPGLFVPGGNPRRPSVPCTRETPCQARHESDAEPASPTARVAVGRTDRRTDRGFRGGRTSALLGLGRLLCFGLAPARGVPGAGHDEGPCWGEPDHRHGMLSKQRIGR